MQKLEAVSLNQITIQRQAADISKHVETHFHKTLNKCVYYSLAVDESLDVTSAAQMCIFAHGITSDF
jgi:hypothetical protein